MNARRLVLWVAVGLLGLGGALLLGGKLWADDLIAEITARTGAPLHMEAPMAYVSDPRITGTAPGPIKGKVALNALRTALAAYPDPLLQQVAPKLLIAGELRLAGYRVGGTIQPGMVLLASDYLLRDAGPSYTRRAFHHEFSSLLIARYPFPMEAWQAHIPPDIAFPLSNEAQLEATTRYIEGEALKRYYEAGFVSDYGASSLENDINTYAELLMDAPETLATLAKAHPRIAAKAALIQGYYITLAPSFAKRFDPSGLPAPTFP
ncbi:hypothetical protein [Vannielia sp.]|uniref:hypothetical protein n=1 Tax=Vannielia sp. TaxID=2813045 RepID=UPI00262C232D|nr:hypothetical protein [Vannielia sp.]MDF1872613.1 hypothetical protein [Vannielia sp.]